MDHYSVYYMNKPGILRIKLDKMYFIHKEAKIRVSPPPFSLVRFILAADERVGICTSDSVQDIL